MPKARQAPIAHSQTGQVGIKLAADKTVARLMHYVHTHDQPI